MIYGTFRIFLWCFHFVITRRLFEISEKLRFGYLHYFLLMKIEKWISFNDLVLQRLGFEHPTFRMRGECSNRLRHRCGHLKVNILNWTESSKQKTYSLAERILWMGIRNIRIRWWIVKIVLFSHTMKFWMFRLKLYDLTPKKENNLNINYRSRKSMIYDQMHMM